MIYFIPATLKKDLPRPDRKYFVGRGISIGLSLGDDGLWRDRHGTVYALREAANSVDDKDVCGVGAIALPDTPTFHRLNSACTPHEFMYSSPGYQAFHTRWEADAHLFWSLFKTGYGAPFAPFAWGVSRVLGGRYWENERTR